MITEHVRVVFTVDLPDHHIASGDVGTVIHMYRDGAAYEVEVFALDGRTLGVVTVEARQIRTMTGRNN